MTDDIWKRDEVASPCIKICVVDPATRLCVGCFRTIDEITQWSRMTNDTRQTILDDRPNREPLLKKRRGGRRRTQTDRA